jgi:hypothetical protein
MGCTIPASVGATRPLRSPDPSMVVPTTVATSPAPSMVVRDHCVPRRASMAATGVAYWAIPVVVFAADSSEH